MSRTVKRTTTEEEVVQDELALEGWFLQKGTNPDIRAIHVEKRAEDGTFHRLHRSTLLPPFDQDLGPVFENHGDGLYRFTSVDQRGKLKGSRTLRVEGYADQARPGPGGRPGAPGGTDAALQEAEGALRHQVRMATLKATLRSLQEDDRHPAGAGQPALTRAEEKLLEEEVQDRSLDRTTKQLALLSQFRGEPARAVDPVGLTRDLLGLAKEMFSGARGSPVGGLKDTLELLAVAKDLLGGGAAGEEGWTGIIRDLIRNPQLLQHVRDMVVADRAAGRPGPPAGAPPGYRPVPPPPPLRPWTQVHPFPTPASPPPAAAPAPAPANNPPPPLPADHPWEILRTKILPALLEGAARGDRDFVRFAELIDRHLPPAGGQPGALEEFVQYEFPVTLERLAQLEPCVREPAVAAWLLELYTFVRDEFFLPEEGTDARAPGGDAGGGAAGEGKGV